MKANATTEQGKRISEVFFIKLFFSWSFFVYNFEGSNSEEAELERQCLGNAMIRIKMKEEQRERLGNKSLALTQLT